MLTPEEKQRHANGNVTVGELTLATPSGNHTYFVGKVGGMIVVSRANNYRFYSAEEARTNAENFRQSCRDAVEKV